MTCSAVDVYLTSSRLLLRPARLEDFDGFASTVSEISREAAWEWFRCMAGCWHLDGLSKLSVFERSSGRYVGFIGPKQLEGWKVPEIGWNIIPDQRGRGYATEATIAVIDWLFDVRDCVEIVHYITVDNLSSQRVATKLGSHRGWPGNLPGQFAHSAQTVEIWGQSREQWDQRRRSIA
jgi:RimJ/RimL family protein N-acetyltransferase